MPDPDQVSAGEVEAYLAATLRVEDGAAAGTRARQHAEGLPDIEVSPLQARLLELLARIAGARRALEIGTLGGYSTLHLARGVGDSGAVVTLELEPHHAAIARESLDDAGVGERVEIRVGRAAEHLQALVDEGAAPFDLVFIDADKESNLAYLDFAMQLTGPGALIVVDNVVRAGDVVHARAGSSMTQGSRAVLEAMGADARLESTALQTVGAKGWDGLAIARRRA